MTDGLHSADDSQEEPIIPDDLRLQPTEEEKATAEDSKKTETIALGIAGQQGEIRQKCQAATETPEAAEAAKETPPKIPSMSVEQFLKSTASPEDKQKRIEQLQSGKAYRFENGKRVQVSVRIDKDDKGNYKDEVTVTKTVDGKTETKKVKLGALKLQIWERDKSEKGKPLLEQNKNVTYRHQDGTVTDKMKFLGMDKTTRQYHFKKEPVGRPFTVAPQDVRICHERNEDGTIKENGTFAITRKVASAPPKEKPAASAAAAEAPATAKTTGTLEGSEVAGEGTTEGAAAPATPSENQTLRQGMEKVLAIKDKDKQREALAELIDQEVEKRMAQRATTDLPSGAAATPAESEESPAAPKEPGRLSKAWTKVKGWLGKLKNLWPGNWRKGKTEKEDAEETEEKKEEPEKKKGKPKKTPEGTTGEKRERAEYAWLDLNTATQRTIDALKELKIKKVAWTQKGPEGGSMTYFGVLPSPLVSVEDSQGRKCIKMVTTHEESANGELKEAVKTFLIPLAEKGEKSPDTTADTAGPGAQKKKAVMSPTPAATVPDNAPKAPPPAPEMAQPVDLSSIQPVLQRKKVEELTQLKKEFENLGEGTSQRNNIEGHFSRDSSALKAVMSALDKKQGNRILVGIERLLARAQFPNLMKVIGAKSQTDRQEIAKAIQAYYERGEAVYPVPLRNQGIEMNSPAGREIVGKAQDEESRKNLLKILQK